MFLVERRGQVAGGSSARSYPQEQDVLCIRLCAETSGYLINLTNAAWLLVIFISTVIIFNDNKLGKACSYSFGFFFAHMLTNS